MLALSLSFDQRVGTEGEAARFQAAQIDLYEKVKSHAAFADQQQEA